MNITLLLESKDGVRTIEIRRNEISYRGLMRCLRSLTGCVVSKAHQDPLNDNVTANIEFKHQSFSLYTPFSDYLISNSPSSRSVEVFEDFVSHLKLYKVRWWEKIF